MAEPPSPIVVRTAPPGAIGAFAFLLGVFAPVFFWIGYAAIRDRYRVQYSEVSRGFFLGPLSAGEGGRFVHVYEGSDAVVFGAGLICAGFLLLVWAVGAVVSSRQQWATRPPGPLAKLGAALFVATVVLLAPPWQVGRSAAMTMFWAAVALWTAGLVGIVRLGPARPEARALAALGLFAATLVAEFGVPLASSGGAILAMVAVFFGLGHTAVLVPTWRRRIVALEMTEAAPPVDLSD
jgi:hypothetical protein